MPRYAGRPGLVDLLVFGSFLGSENWHIVPSTKSCSGNHRGHIHEFRRGWFEKLVVARSKPSTHTKF
jgi:hypothetical protein